MAREMSYLDNIKVQVASWPWTVNSIGFEDLIHPEFSAWDSEQCALPESGTSIVNPLPRNSTPETKRRSTLMESRDIPCADNVLCYDGLSHTSSEKPPPPIGFPIGLPSSEYAKTSQHYEEKLGYEGNTPFTKSDGMDQQLHQRSLSGCHINTEENPLNTQRLSDLNASRESEANNKKTRRKRAHSLIEKRSRENLNLKFLELEKTLTHRRSSSKTKNLTPDKTPQRMKRAAILDHAHNTILELEVEVQSLKQKIQTLREIAFPDTCKFTLHVD